MSRAHLRHVLEAGHCRAGIRAWCEANGVPLSDLVGPQAPGVDLGRLRAIGDRHAAEVIAIVEAEEARGG